MLLEWFRSDDRPCAHMAHLSAHVADCVSFEGIKVC
jgi:hypothetical protein